MVQSRCRRIVLIIAVVTAFAVVHICPVVRVVSALPPSSPSSIWGFRWSSRDKNNSTKVDESSGKKSEEESSENSSSTESPSTSAPSTSNNRTNEAEARDKLPTTTRNADQQPHDHSGDGAKTAHKKKKRRKVKKTAVRAKSSSSSAGEEEAKQEDDSSVDMSSTSPKPPVRTTGWWGRPRQRPLSTTVLADDVSVDTATDSTSSTIEETIANNDSHNVQSSSPSGDQTKKKKKKKRLKSRHATDRTLDAADGDVDSSDDSLTSTSLPERGHEKGGSPSSSNRVVKKKKVKRRRRASSKLPSASDTVVLDDSRAVQVELDMTVTLPTTTKSVPHRKKKKKKRKHVDGSSSSSSSTRDTTEAPASLDLATAASSTRSSSLAAKKKKRKRRKGTAVADVTMSEHDAESQQKSQNAVESEPHETSVIVEEAISNEAFDDSTTKIKSSPDTSEAMQATTNEEGTPFHPPAARVISPASIEESQTTLNGTSSDDIDQKARAAAVIGEEEDGSPLIGDHGRVDLSSFIKADSFDQNKSLVIESNQTTMAFGTASTTMADVEQHGQSTILAPADVPARNESLWGAAAEVENAAPADDDDESASSDTLTNTTHINLAAVVDSPKELAGVANISASEPQPSPKELAGVANISASEPQPLDETVEMPVSIAAYEKEDESEEESTQSELSSDEEVESDDAGSVSPSSIKPVGVSSTADNSAFGAREETGGDSDEETVLTNLSSDDEGDSSALTYVYSPDLANATNITSREREPGEEMADESSSSASEETEEEDKDDSGHTDSSSDDEAKSSDAELLPPKEESVDIANITSSKQEPEDETVDIPPSNETEDTDNGTEDVTAETDSSAGGDKAKSSDASLISSSEAMEANTSLVEAVPVDESLGETASSAKNDMEAKSEEESAGTDSVESSANTTETVATEHAEEDTPEVEATKDDHEPSLQPETSKAAPEEEAIDDAQSPTTHEPATDAAIDEGKKTAGYKPSRMIDLATLAAAEDHDTDMCVSVVTWNLAEESPEEEEARFIRRFRKGGTKGKGSDFVLFGAQECENIKPRRAEGRRSREIRRLMIKMLGEKYVPIAIHSIGGIQFGLFCKRSILHNIEHVSVADVTCGIGNVFHNKGAIAAFVQMKARRQKEEDKSIKRAKSLKMLFVTAHMAAHVKNFDARDADFWRIVTELESQAPPAFVSSRRREDTTSTTTSALLDSMDRIFFCGDLNYRVDLPREIAEHSVLEMTRLLESTNEEPILKAEKIRNDLLKHDQLLATMAEQRAFPGFAEGMITFPPTFKFDKGTEHYDSSHKQRIPAWTDRILFKPFGTRVLEYDAILDSQHSDHRPVFATIRVSRAGRELPKRNKTSRKKSKKRSRKPKSEED